MFARRRPLAWPAEDTEGAPNRPIVLHTDGHMSGSFYADANSGYLKNNPTWHMEDSPWKARLILRMMEKNHLQPKTICEIGCGAGEILNQLHMAMPNNVSFTGYEISNDALMFCRQRVKERLDFKQQSLFEMDRKFDLLLMIDVFEHVEDYFGFIRASREKAEYKIFHIPLDITALGVFRNRHMGGRKSLGHLHYFTKDTALATLQDCGLEIVDHFYTPALDVLVHRTFKAKVGVLMKRVLYGINNDLGARLLGGYALMVLAK